MHIDPQIDINSQLKYVKNNSVFCHLIKNQVSQICKIFILINRLS